MARTLDSGTNTAVTSDITKPYFLVYMAFDTPVLYSSYLATTDDTVSPQKTYSAASIEINWTSAGPTLVIFNESKTFGQVVLSEGTSGRQVTIRQTYHTGSGNTDPIEIFDGEMGEAEIGDYVRIKCRYRAPHKTPRLYAAPPTFNHIPKTGTKIETRNQVIVLETN